MACSQLSKHVTSWLESSSVASVTSTEIAWLPVGEVILHGAAVSIKGSSIGVSSLRTIRTEIVVCPRDAWSASNLSTSIDWWVIEVHIVKIVLMTHVQRMVPLFSGLWGMSLIEVKVSFIEVWSLTSSATGLAATTSSRRMLLLFISLVNRRNLNFGNFFLFLGRLLSLSRLALSTFLNLFLGKFFNFL